MNELEQKVVELEKRVAQLEQQQFNMKDFVECLSNFVAVRDYEEDK